MRSSLKGLRPDNSEHSLAPSLSPAANNNVAFANGSCSDSAGTERPDLETFKLQITENSRLDRRDGWTPGYVTLEEFEKRLLTHRQINRKKDGKAFVPGVVQGDRRKKTAVSELTALVIDLDKGEDLKEVNAAIRAKGLYAIVHTTFSHLNSETEINLDAYRKFVGNNEVTSEGLQRYLIEVSQYRPWVVEQVEIASDCRDTAQGVVCVARHKPLPKLRIVFPLRKPFKRRDVMKAGFNQADFEKQWKAKYAKFANSLCVVWDKTCTDVSRCFFYPSCKTGVRRGARKIEGQLLDLDSIEVGPPSDQACVDKLVSSNREAHHQKGQQHTFKGFNLKSWIAQFGSKFEIESALRANKEDAFFRSERDAGGVHIPCPFEDEHSEADGTGTFVVNASDNEGHAGFGIYCCHNSCLTRRGNGTGNGVDRLLFIHKMLEEEWLTLDDLQNPKIGGGEISGRSTNASYADPPEGPRFPDRNAKGGIHTRSLHNVLAFVDWCGVTLRWNSFIDRYELTGLKGHRYLSDKSAAELWGRAHKIKFRVDKGFQRDCLEVLALRQEVHPVRDYFDGLLDKWDGVARLDLWLPAYLKAAENDYTCAAGAKTLIAAVRRIKQPGTKFDQLLILEGEQGTGKSTALKILTTREGWFTDCVSLTNDPKIMIEQTEGKLIVEVPELKGMRKAEIEHVKATLSRTHDRARKAYGRYTDEVPRQFILIGTTNTEKGGECWYLKDPTGNRRFWPIKTGEIDLAKLERDREQLWAEAVAREAMGESVELPRELWNAAQLEQQARMERDPWVEELGNELGDFEGKLLTTDARLIVSRNLANWGAFQNERLGRAMRELGWQRKYLRHKKGRAYFYVKGEEPWRKVLVTVESSSQVSLCLDKREDGEHGA